MNSRGTETHKHTEFVSACRVLPVCNRQNYSASFAHRLERRSSSLYQGDHAQRRVLQALCGRRASVTVARGVAHGPDLSRVRAAPARHGERKGEKLERGGGGDRER